MPQITLARFPIRLPVKKTCCTCKKGEPEIEFYKGRSNKCKSCYRSEYKNKSDKQF